MKALVIAAFPGCGKSVYYQYNSVYSSPLGKLKIVDLDSSAYSWIYDNFGHKTSERSSEFPNNYVTAIKRLLRKEQIILVSTHSSVLEALYNAKIPFVLVYPKDTIINMKEWKARFMDRGNTQQYIASQMENWSNYIKQLDDCKYTNHKYILDAEHGQFFLNRFLVDRIKEDLKIEF